MTDVRYLNVETYNVSLIGSLYDKNGALNYIKYHMIFFARRNCDNYNISYYDPITHDCFVTCDDVVSSYSNTSPYYLGTSNVCVPCHYSCMNCTSTACTICPVDSFRKSTPSGKVCDCLTGYVDDGVRIC
jgi:hypothetical protein